jgi:hypothetical protein
MKIRSALIALFAAAVLTGGAALASGETKAKTHDVNATIVSVDAKAKTVTFKIGEAAETKTAPVMESAVAAMGTIKAGDQVTLTCADDEKGAHHGIAAIKPAPKKG